MIAVVTYSHKGNVIEVTLTHVIACPNGDIVGKNPVNNELIWVPVEELYDVKEV